MADQPQFSWRFVVIEDAKQQNAFCLPGGKVAVYTGMLPLAQTTTGLGVVLGHEIAHAVARHGAERVSQAMVAETGGALLGALFGSSPGANALLTAYGAGAQVGVLLPYGRAQESEADHIGLLLMARAATIRAKRSPSGSAWSVSAARARRNFSRHIRVAARGSNRSANGCRKRSHFTRRRLVSVTNDCRRRRGEERERKFLR